MASYQYASASGSAPTHARAARATGSFNGCVVGPDVFGAAAVPGALAFAWPLALGGCGVCASSRIALDCGSLAIGVLSSCASASLLARDGSGCVVCATAGVFP